MYLSAPAGRSARRRLSPASEATLIQAPTTKTTPPTRIRSIGALVIDAISAPTRKPLMRLNPTAQKTVAAAVGLNSLVSGNATALLA